MTRAERAAEKVRKEKEKLAEQQRLAKAREAEQRQSIKVAEAQVREATRQATHKRRYHVGAMADEKGLFVWDNTTLAAVFTLLATLKDCPDPVAVLEGVLSDVETGVAGVRV